MKNCTIISERTGGIRHVASARCSSGSRDVGAQHQGSCPAIPLSLANVPHCSASAVILVHGGRGYVGTKEIPPERSLRGAQL